jgi:hypothetical protein
MSHTATVTVNTSVVVTVPIPFDMGGQTTTVIESSSHTFQIDNGFMLADERSLASGASETHDLTSLQQIDPDGTSVGAAKNFANAYLVWIKNTSTNSAAVVTVGAAVATQFLGTGTVGQATASVSIKQGDAVPFHVNNTGLSTTGAVSLKVAMSGAAGKYKMIVAGA